MFLKVDGTIFIQLINFAIFFAILNVVFLRPVSAAIRRRREYINSLTNDYDRFQAEAASLRTQAESIRAAARRKAEQTLLKERAEVSNETAELAARFAQEAGRTVEAAHEQAAQELESARRNEAQIVKQLADEMIQKTLRVAA